MISAGEYLLISSVSFDKDGTLAVLNSPVVISTKDLIFGQNAIEFLGLEV